MATERAKLNDVLHSQACAGFLRSIADPERLRIVQCLMAGPHHVGEMADQLGVAFPNLSHHLGVLRHARLVDAEKRGRFVFYRLAPGVYESPADTDSPGYLNFGCCRLEIPAGSELNG